MDFKNKRVQILILLVVVLIGFISYRIFANIQAGKAKALNSRSSKEVVVATGHPVRKTIIPKIKFSGTLDPIWQADVAAKVDGRLEVLYVQEGERVASGQKLALLEQTDVSANVLNAQGSYLDAQTNLEKAQRDYERYEQLYKGGAISESIKDNYRFAVQNAESKLSAAKGNLDAAQSKMNGTLVTTPHAGIIQKRYYQEGYYAKLGTALFNIADISTLRAKINVPEGYVDSLAIGSTVDFTITSLPAAENKVVGRIQRIAPVADQPSRTFEAEVLVDNGNGRLHGGIYADALLTTQPKANALVIPLSAMVMRDDQQTVFVIGEDGTAIRRVLRTGYIGDDIVEILGGISENDLIVTGGQNKIREGSKVNLGEKGTD